MEVRCQEPWGDWARDQLDGVRAAGRWRSTRALDALGPIGELDGQRVVSYASNDYLGLSAHPAVRSAAHAAIDRWGTGATSARLIVGTRPAHDELEGAIADWKHTERALVFPSGFAANLGVLSAFGGRDVTVFSDELNHASIVDGCRLGRSGVTVYRHNDVGHLAAELAASSGRRIVVTDSVFSMDGDVAHVAALADVCVRFGALLVLDEAHAVFGPELPDVDGLEVVRVGTLSKTLGALGGWVAASAPLVDVLVNRARPFIFTTGLAPADVAAAHAALGIVRSAEGDALVAHLRTLVDLVRRDHPSPIVPVVLGDEERAVKAASALLERQILVPAIRPPTVAPGTSRLRITLSAAHTPAMVEHLLDALESLGITA